MIGIDFDPLGVFVDVERKISSMELENNHCFRLRIDVRNGKLR